MKRNLMLLWVLALSLRALAADSGQATASIVQGYQVRSGDCPGNDISNIHGFVSLSECARRCKNEPTCVSFMFSDGRECYPKTMTCKTTDTANPKNFFYDKIPEGYTMRPGDCRGNDIWNIFGFATLSECAQRCNNEPTCVSFMFYHWGRECYPKTKTCKTTDTANAKNFFYDKIPEGYTMRPGDCPGNDILNIHGFVSLSECAQRCNNEPTCVSFMFNDGRECYPKTKTCNTPDSANPQNFFYDKIPEGYTMRPGDCPGNVLNIFVFVSLAECARRCNNEATCVSFIFFDGSDCFLKTKTCKTTDTANPQSFFYDKVPEGYTMRPGDCPGNDIWNIHGFVSLSECARRCNNEATCVSFMFHHDGHECYPKTKTCKTTDTANLMNFFYDKIVMI